MVFSGRTWKKPIGSGLFFFLFFPNGHRSPVTYFLVGLSAGCEDQRQGRERELSLSVLL